MTDQQWDKLKKLISGESKEVLSAFISDSAWLPDNYDISVNDYFMDDEAWFNSHAQSMLDFPEVLFVPGFWADYGMATEPSAFGCKCQWLDKNLPHAEPFVDAEYFEEGEFEFKIPNPETDGMAPFSMSRLRRYHDKIEATGHKIRFASSRGPFTVAQFLLGAEEFLVVMKTDPDLLKDFLSKVTDYIVRWVKYQKQCNPTIDGIQLNDDVLGFVGGTDFIEFAMPCLKKIYSAFDCNVHLLHSDATGLNMAPYLTECGIDIFNFSYNHSMAEMRKASGEKLILMGNLSPIKVMSDGSKEDIINATKEILEYSKNDNRILVSTGGGLPQGLSKKNLRICVDEINKFNKN